MRMPISTTEAGQAERGFTLVELLAVLSILAIAAALFSFRLQSGFGTSKFRALLTDVAGSLRETRSAAIATGADSVFVIDTARRTVGKMSVPQVVAFSVEAAQSETQGAQTGVRFFKDGSSTGGTLTFTWQDRKAAIDVNWLTGNVAIRQD